MNEELKKIITYVIDNGIKSYEWNEDWMDSYRWTIENDNSKLKFIIYFHSTNKIDYSLNLFINQDFIDYLSFDDIYEINSQKRDELIDHIKKLELIP